MKNILALLALACLTSTHAYAQKSYQACMRSCVEVGPSTEKKAQFDRKMAEVGAKKSKESDPQKLALLKDEEESILDKHEAESEKLCRYICEGMPGQ